MEFIYFVYLFCVLNKMSANCKAGPSAAVIISGEVLTLKYSKEGCSLFNVQPLIILIHAFSQVYNPNIIPRVNV